MTKTNIPSIYGPTHMTKAIQGRGLPATEIVADGQIHRFGEKNNCWYVCYGNAGAYGDWSQDIKENWSVEATLLSSKERKLLAEQIAEAKAMFNAELKRKHEETSKIAGEEWVGLSPTGSSFYLKRKKVTAYGIKYGGHYWEGKPHPFIAIPLSDHTGKVWSLQKINDNGDKWFLPGGKKKGCFHLIGTIEEEKPFIIAEGYATAVSLHMATGYPCIVAFDAGNLEPVAASFRRKYPHTPIIIAADNDQWKEYNTGKTKATEAAARHGCAVALPVFSGLKPDQKPTDFNDLHMLEGLEAVKAQIPQNLQLQSMVR